MLWLKYDVCLALNTNNRQFTLLLANPKATFLTLYFIQKHTIYNNLSLISLIGSTKHYKRTFSYNRHVEKFLIKPGSQTKP